MALTDKLTAIANAIRAKDGSTATMTLAQMPEKIAAMEKNIATLALKNAALTIADEIYKIVD